MTSWLDDPDVAHIERGKLDFLQMLVFESNGLTKEQMLPFLMAVAKRGRDNNISFTDDEINIIVKTIKKYATPEECEKMDKMVTLFYKKR